MPEGYPQEMTTARRLRLPLVRTLLGFGALLASLPATGASAVSDAAPDRSAWTQSPYRHFRAAQAVTGARALLYDEVDDPGLAPALASRLRWLFDDLYAKQGWRMPFGEDDTLRIYVARGQAGGAHEMSAAGTAGGRLVSPAVLLDATGLSTPQIVREVGRQVVLATLAGYQGPGDSYLGPALAEALCAPRGSDARPEETWIAAAANLLDYRAQPAILGRLWVDEVVRSAGGTTILREAWERAAGLGEPALPVLLRLIPESTGESPESILLRSAARLYASEEPDASASRLRLLDVESGAIDAAAPAALTVRHRTFLPETDETLRVTWPQDGGPGAAVVRYRDAALPSDLVLFAAGDQRAVPLSGVARIDWVVAGSDSGGRGFAAPVYCELSPNVPYSRLDARAAAGADGPRLTWTTASHEGLWGWAVFREEVLPDGRIARTGPEIVPSSERAAEPFRYEFVDSTSTSGTYYRYTVWAVTSEGVLARAFAATLKTD
jgi:hypothetical protein